VSKFFLSQFKLSKHSNFTELSFKEFYDITKLPLVVIEIAEKPFIFLLDSGSNMSILTKDILSEIKGHYRSKSNKKMTMAGSVGSPEECNIQRVKLEFDIDGIKMTETMHVQNIPAFDVIREETGTSIQGVLGSDFLSKYHVIIDFKNFIISLENG